MTAVIGSMFGGGQPPQQMQDFANRYEQGAQDFSDQEVAQHYQQVASQLPPDQFQQAALQAFSRMSPEERAQFAQMLLQHTQRQGMGMPQMQGGAYQDPNALAQMTTQVHQQNPGLLGQLLGGGQGGGQTWETLDPQTRDLFIRTWGNRAQQEWEMENARAHSPMNSPVAKAVMAGIAAIAVKQMMGR